MKVLLTNTRVSFVTAGSCRGRGLNVPNLGVAGGLEMEIVLYDKIHRCTCFSMSPSDCNISNIDWDVAGGCDGDCEASQQCQPQDTDKDLHVPLADASLAVPVVEQLLPLPLRPLRPPPLRLHCQYQCRPTPQMGRHETPLSQRKYTVRSGKRVTSFIIHLPGE